MSKSSARTRAGNGLAPAIANWHRRIGIGAALVVVWLALTGMLLGHTDDLGLDERHLGAAWLLDWYGVPAPAVLGYRAGDDWVAQAGTRIYLDDRPVEGEYGRLSGAVRLADEIVVAVGGQLLVLTDSGDRVEVLGPAHGVPEEIQRLGVRNGQLVVRTEQGERAASEDLLAWRRLPAANADWSQAADVPASLRNRIVKDYRGRVLTLERLILDLHSGRLIGRLGILLMDLAAVALLVLAGSGLWLWLLRAPATRKFKGVRR